MELKERYRIQNMIRRGRKIDAAVKQLREWCEVMNVDGDTAEAAYREAVEAGLLRGRHERGLQAASIYAGSRRSGDCVTMTRVAEVTGERLVTVQRMAMLLREKFGFPPQDIKHYIDTNARKLGMKPDYALVDLDALDESLAVPMRTGIALRVMSCVAGTPHSVAEISRVVGLNPKSLRNYVTPKGILKPKALKQ